ncbi:MAG: transketolase C-terminal domain-containing protein [Candidatus Beckwithbacteria bacterium]|nr:hypothetical protein [Patescibacteria group bacterium]
MRQTFITTVEKLAQTDPRLVVLTGDLGFTVLENFRDQFPDRFFNLGVAESNLMSVAAGMALSDQIPIVYSISNFVTLRPFEFIRNDIGYQNANVKIVGVGGGFGYGLAGITHQNLEDISLLKTIPNLTIISPSDPIETAILTRLAIKHQGPVYLRLGKVGESNLHSKSPKLKLGQGFIFNQGTKLAIFTAGGITANVLEACKILKTNQLNPTIINLHTIKPLDTKLIIKIASQHQHLFSVEEHLLVGGLGSSLAEILVDKHLPTPLTRLGIKLYPKHHIGNQNFLRHLHGLSPQKIAQTILTSLNE